ncbi:MAG: LuxR C-terminal-related transcriptional regulator [Actinomycetota bacterium]
MSANGENGKSRDPEVSVLCDNCGQHLEIRVQGAHDASGHDIPAQSRRPSEAPLTNYELQILCCIADGMTDMQIAGRLHSSISRVKHTLRHLLLRLDARNRTQAAVNAQRSGYLPAD